MTALLLMDHAVRRQELVARLAALLRARFSTSSARVRGTVCAVPRDRSTRMASAVTVTRLSTVTANVVAVPVRGVSARRRRRSAGHKMVMVLPVQQKCLVWGMHSARKGVALRNRSNKHATCIFFVSFQASASKFYTAILGLDSLTFPSLRPLLVPPLLLSRMFATSRSYSVIHDVFILSTRLI